MTYHRRNKKKTSKKVVIIISTLLILFLFGSTVKGFVQWTAVPIIVVKNTVTYPFKSLIEQFRFKSDLIDQNEQLKKENRRLEIENLTVDSLRRENESLKGLINYSGDERQYKTAKVLNQPPFSPYDTFIIDMGSDENLSVGENIYYLGVMIGQVEEIYTNTSVIRLKSSPGKVFDVSVSGEQTEAVGIGGGGFMLSLPKDFEVQERETIFVGDNPIGRVDFIETDETGAFQNIYFRYPFNMNDIDFVEILNENK